MNSTRWVWPKDNQSLWNIKNQEYIVEIKWSKKPFEDYMRLAKEYAQFGYLIFKEVIESGHDNVKSDMWFLPGIYCMRQSMELGLKALICRVCDRKPDIQGAFEDCCHDLSELFSWYDAKNEDYLLEEEKQWLIKYLASIEEVDEKSDMFRFPFEDEFLAQYRNKFLNNVTVANNMVQAFTIISKCLNCGVYDTNSELDVNWEPQFLILASHGIGNCYLWEPISDNGFHSKVTGYTAVAEFIYYECDNITLEEKLYPLLFLLRNSIELCLKRLFYSNVDNGISKHIFFSKRRSHLLKKDLWKYVRPMILNYTNESNEDLKDIDVVETMISELDALDKKGDCFRYPTSYSLEYRNNGKILDLENVFKYMKAVINFLEGCDSMLDSISDYESEMNSCYDEY
jgi:hypothetical protein